MTKHKKQQPKRIRGQAKKPETGRIPINTAFDREEYQRILKLKKQLGLILDQDVVRVAVKNFLDRNNIF